MTALIPNRSKGEALTFFLFLSLERSIRFCLRMTAPTIPNESTKQQQFIYTLKGVFDFAWNAGTDGFRSGPNPLIIEYSILLRMSAIIDSDGIQIHFDSKGIFGSVRNAGSNGVRRGLRRASNPFKT